MEKKIGTYFGAVSILMRTRRVEENGREAFFFFFLLARLFSVRQCAIYDKSGNKFYLL